MELVAATRLEVTVLEHGTQVPFAFSLRASDGFIDRTTYRTDVLQDYGTTRMLPPGSYRVEAKVEDRLVRAEIELSGEARRQCVCVDLRVAFPRAHGFEVDARARDGSVGDGCPAVVEDGRVAPRRRGGPRSPSRRLARPRGRSGRDGLHLDRWSKVANMSG